MRRSVRMLLTAAVVGVTAWLSGCGGSSPPQISSSSEIGRAIDEHIYADGFDFLPPLDAGRALSGFNATATPVVEIYAGAEADKTASTRLLKRFESTEIAVEEDHFHVNWDTGAIDGGLPDAITDCVIEVSWETAGARELLGYVDCSIDKPAGKAKKATDPADYVFFFQDGRTLPIKFAIDAAVPPPVDITVSSASPGSAQQGATVDLTIAGAGFKLGAAVSLSGSGITVLTTTFVSSQELVASLSIDQDAALGARDVSVTNPGGYAAALAGAFEVLPGVVLAERILYSSGVGWETNIWSLNPDGSDQRQLTSLPGREDYPSVTPDGRQILFHHGPEPLADIWIMDSDGSNAHELIALPGDDLFPIVSPDGAAVLYTSNRGGSYQQWLTDLASGTSLQLTHDPASAWLGTFTPDGSRVYFESYRRGNAGIWSIAIDGSDEREHTNPGQDGVRRFPVVSPNGLQLSLTYPALYLMDLSHVPGGAGMTATGVAAIKSRAWFSPDGQWLVLNGQSGPTQSRIFKVPAAGPYVQTDLIPSGLGIVNNAPFWGVLAQ